jgi:hypothetical protein
VDTRFKLPTDQVDVVIESGHDALRANPIFRDFLAGVGSRRQPRLPRKPPEGAPVAAVPVEQSPASEVPAMAYTDARPLSR